MMRDVKKVSTYPKGNRRNRVGRGAWAVGPDRFFGRSANWTPLSVSTISTLRGAAATKASKKVRSLYIGLVDQPSGAGF
jgi:hypothetical protein